MKLCNLYLKRFDLTKGLSFDTFSSTVWYKLCRYDHSLLELESFSPPINWLIEQEASNQMHSGLSKQIVQIFNKTKCAAGKTYQTKCAAGQNL